MTEFAKVSKVVDGLTARIAGLVGCMERGEWYSGVAEEVRLAAQEWGDERGRERLGKIVARKERGDYGDSMAAKVAALKGRSDTLEATLARLRKWVQKQQGAAAGAAVRAAAVATPSYLEGWRLASCPSEAALAPIRFVPVVPEDAPPAPAAAAVGPRVSAAPPVRPKGREGVPAASPLARTCRPTPIPFSTKSQPPPALGCLKGVDVSVLHVDAFERHGRELPALHHGVLFLRGPKYTPYHGRYWAATVDVLKNCVVSVGDFKGMLDARRPAVPPAPLAPFAAHLLDAMAAPLPPPREAAVRMKLAAEEYEENVALARRFRTALLALRRRHAPPRDAVAALEEFLFPPALVVWVPHG